MDIRKRRNFLEKKVSKLIQSNRSLKRKLLIAKKQLNQREIEYARLMENYFSIAMNVIEINQLKDRNNVNGFNVISKDLIMWAVENEKKVQQQKFVKHLTFIETQMTSFLKLCSDISSKVLDTKNYTKSILNSFEEKSNFQNYDDILVENSSTQHVPYEYQIGQTLAIRNQKTVSAAPELQLQSTSFNKVNDEGYLSANVGHSLQSESSTSEYSDNTSDAENCQIVQEYYDAEEKHTPDESILNNNSCNVKSIGQFHDSLSENRQQGENTIGVTKCTRKFLNRSNKNLEKCNEHLQNAIHDNPIDEEILLEFKRSVNSSYDILESKSDFSSLVEDELKKPLHKNIQPLISEASSDPLCTTDNDNSDKNRSGESDFEKQWESFTSNIDNFEKLSDENGTNSDCDSEIEGFTGFTSKDIHLAIQSIEELLLWKNIVGSNATTH